MNWLDFLLLFFAVWCFFDGARKGLLIQVCQLLSTVAAFVIALRWGMPLGIWLGELLPVDGLLERRVSTTAPETIFNEKVIPEELTVFSPEVVANWMNATLLSLLGFILVFFFSLIVLLYLCRALKVLKFIPIIGPINNVGGGLVGFFKCLLFLFIILGLITFFSSEALSNLLRRSAFISILSHYFDSLYTLVSNYLIDNISSDINW